VSRRNAVITLFHPLKAIKGLSDPWASDLCTFIYGSDINMSWRFWLMHKCSFLKLRLLRKGGGDMRYRWPSEDVASKPNYTIKTYFNEDDIGSINGFEDRSSRMLFLFIKHLKTVVSGKGNNRIRTFHFHNLRRFDGILLIKYFINKGLRIVLN